MALSVTVPAAQAQDLRVSKNYRLPADPSPFRGKDQVNLAVNPNNPQHVVAANVDFLDEHCEASASFDGGATWSPSVQLEEPTLLESPFMPSCRVSSHSGESMFQGLAFGTGQNVYATTITPRVSATGEEGAATLIYKSTDGGVTWGDGVIAMPGGPGGDPAYELPIVLVDPGAGTNGQDRVYSVARDAGGTPDVVRVARSDDGGQTFGAPVDVSPATANVVDNAAATIDADGNLGISYRTRGDTTQPANGNPGEVHFVRSTDDGETWSAPVVVTVVTNRALSSRSAIDLAPSSASTFPRMAVNRQNGNLYIVYNQGAEPPTAPPGGYQGTDHFIPPDTDVYFQRSLDDGATWSEPELINDTTLHPGVQRTQTRHPDVVVAPNGRVDIVWEDRRHWYQPPGERQCPHTHRFCQEARLGDTYYAYSTDHGASFSDDRRITDHSHNNDVGYDYRFATYWAFGPQAVPMGSDEILVGWMDSREGNWDDDNQDFYLAKIDHTPAATIPQERIDQPGPISLSVALSKRTYMGGGEGLMASGFATRNGTRVVIVNQDDVPGALAGSVLARANLGPVLLSGAGGLSAAAQLEVARLNPEGAYVIGDTSKLSDQVVTDLTAAMGSTATIDRLSGAGDSGTAAAIATALDRRTDAEKAADQPAFDAVIIANPSSPDAVAASALAAARRLPILYVSQNDVPAATAAALATLDVDRTLVIGDTSQVSNGVAAGLPGTSERLGGTDAYATSRAVAAESVERGLPTNIVYVASGARPMDAALLGFAVGRSTGIMVLAPGSPTATAAATAAGAGLTGIDRLVVVEATPVVQPGPPATPPGQTPPPPPPPAPATGKATAKLSLARATINRRDRVLDVLAPITSLASGRVNVELHAAGRRFRFTAPVNSADGRIRFRQRIPAAQARMGTGILTIRYNGDADTRPQTVRLRAALQKAQLRLTRPTIANNGRLRASGTVSNRARGVVRVQLEYDSGGRTRTHQFLARINNGRWSLNHQLSQTIRNEIATRTGTVHSYTLFTGYLPARMRGEMRSFQVLGAR